MKKNVKQFTENTNENENLKAIKAYLEKVEGIIKAAEEFKEK